MVCRGVQWKATACPRSEDPAPFVTGLTGRRCRPFTAQKPRRVGAGPTQHDGDEVAAASSGAFSGRELVGFVAARILGELRRHLNEWGVVVEREIIVEHDACPVERVGSSQIRRGVKEHSDGYFAPVKRVDHGATLQATRWFVLPQTKEAIMATLDVQRQSSKFGFRLEKIRQDDKTLWMWRRGTDESGPVFLTERAALEWMHDHLSRVSGPDPAPLR